MWVWYYKNLNLNPAMGKVKQMIDTDIENYFLQIEAILEEASNYNLRIEVQKLAEKWIKEDPTIDPIEAYQTALLEWIK